MAQLSRKHFRLFATLLAETCPEGHHIDSVTPLTFKQREINANREEVKLWDTFLFEISEFLNLSNPRFSFQVFNEWIESRIKEREEEKKERYSKTEKDLLASNALAEEMRKAFAKLQ